MDREAWTAAIHGITKNRTRQSNSTELNHGLVFLKTSPTQEPIKSHLIKTKDIATSQEIPRNIRDLCQESESRSSFRTQDAPVPL